MTAKMPRPRFSLRTLLVVVTVVVVATWYLRPAEIEIIGDISRTDVAAICRCVDDLNKTSKARIRTIRLLAPDQVEVTFKELVRGPLGGGGTGVTLEKINGTWILTGVSGQVF